MRDDGQLIFGNFPHLTPDLLSNRFDLTFLSIVDAGAHWVRLFSIMRLRFGWRMPPASKNGVVV